MKFDTQAKTWSELEQEWLAAERWFNETDSLADMARAEKRQLDIENEWQRRRDAHKIGTDGMHYNQFCVRCYENADNLSATCKKDR